MEKLAYFLQSNCSYTKGAEIAGMATGNFRLAVMEELRELERSTGVSFHPLRAPHLRAQAEKIMDLLETCLIA